MTSRERVRSALAFRQPDITPCDYFATPEIHQALLAHFRVDTEEELRVYLGTDIQGINPPYIGPELPVLEDGSVMNIWGIQKKPMPNEYGDYMESVNYPYARWTILEEAEAFSWPDPEWYDYSAVPSLCPEYPDKALMTGSFAIQDFINGITLGRGVEQVLIDIAVEDPVFSISWEKGTASTCSTSGESSNRQGKGSIWCCAGMISGASEGFSFPRLRSTRF